jgi:hypothetical protein
MDIMKRMARIKTLIQEQSVSVSSPTLCPSLKLPFGVQLTPGGSPICRRCYKRVAFVVHRSTAREWDGKILTGAVLTRGKVDVDKDLPNEAEISFMGNRSGAVRECTLWRFTMSAAQVGMVWQGSLDVDYFNDVKARFAVR